MSSFKINKLQFAEPGNINNALIIKRMHPCANFPNCEMASCTYGECSGFIPVSPDLIRMEIEKLMGIISEGEN